MLDKVTGIALLGKMRPWKEEDIKEGIDKYIGGAMEMVNQMGESFLDAKDVEHTLVLASNSLCKRVERINYKTNDHGYNVKEAIKAITLRRVSAINPKDAKEYIVLTSPEERCKSELVTRLFIHRDKVTYFIKGFITALKYEDQDAKVAHINQMITDRIPLMMRVMEEEVRVLDLIEEWDREKANDVIFEVLESHMTEHFKGRTFPDTVSNRDILIEYWKVVIRARFFLMEDYI